MPKIFKKKSLFLLLIILVIASFFRLWQLDSIPPGLYPDVAMNGNDALETLKTGDFRVFYPDNNGREGLFMWLITFSFSFFGISVWSIKIVAAVIGILTVFGLYLLTKELFSNLTMKQFNPAPESSVRYGASNPTIIALLSSFFLAISFWHVNFSRIGFRAILLPFILVFAFYFLLKGFRTKKLLNFLVSGIFFGLGFYTYISYRFIIILLPLILICWFLIYQKEKQTKKFLLFTGYCLLVTFIIVLPLGLYFLQNPQDFLGRATPISIFAAENPIKEFGKSLILHLGMFNFYGDSNWRHNFAGSPQLFWPIGILFLIGIVISIKNLIASVKNKNCSLFTVHFSLLSWFLIMLLPGILTWEGIPHALRTIGVIPVVYIFAGLGGWFIYRTLNSKIEKQFGENYKKLAFLVVLFFLGTVGYAEFNKYFFNWARNPQVAAAFTKRYAEIGYFLNSLPNNVQKYVIPNELGVPLYGISIPAQTPIFIEATQCGLPRSTYLGAENLDQIHPQQGKTIIIPLYNGKVLEELQKKFPQGRVREEKDFWRYEIEI